MKILIIEDDLDIAKLEKDYLAMAGFATEIVNDGKDALKAFRAEDFALVILDLMLPNVDGYEICRRIRELSDVPIIMVSAKSQAFDIVRGLGLGSDNYITKPFDPAVLVAHVKSALENYQRRKNLDSEIKIGRLKIIPENFQVFLDEKEIKLPHREFELLVYLAEHPNIVFSKEDLFEAVWGMDSLAGEATVTVHVNRLREKLEKNPEKPELIETIWGVGYRLRA